MFLGFIGGVGPTEMIVIGVVAVLLFGSRLPSVARSAGKSLTEFKRGMQDLQSDFKRSIDLEETMRYEPPLSNGGDSSESDASDNTQTAGDTGAVDDEDDPALKEGYPEPRSPVI